VPLWLRRTTAGVLSWLPAWGNHRGLLRRAQKFTHSASLPFDERFSRWISVFSDDLPRLLPGHVQHPPHPLGLTEPSLKDGEIASPLAKLLYVNFKTYLVDDLLVKMDRCSMAHALETRSPFLDRDLVEYVFRLPDQMKLRWGRTKVLLRKAFADLLPAPILRRGKMGFGVPLQTWFKADLQAYLQDTLVAPDAKLRDYVDQRYVCQLVQAHLSGRMDHSHRLWTLVTFEVWLRQLPTWRTRWQEVEAAAPISPGTLS
jgi:asparagine synthase (glutamine-hydrolysing)